MSCTGRIAKLLSQAVPHIESFENAVVKKATEIVTRENANKAYASILNAFSSCRRKKDTVEAAAAPVAEDRRNFAKKAM